MDEDHEDELAAIRARADQFDAMLTEAARCAATYMTALCESGVFYRHEALELVRDMASNLQDS